MGLYGLVRPKYVKIKQNKCQATNHHQEIPQQSMAQAGSYSSLQSYLDGFFGVWHEHRQGLQSTHESQQSVEKKLFNFFCSIKLVYYI